MGPLGYKPSALAIKVVDSCRIFSETWLDNFRSVLVYGHELGSRKKYFITVQKEFIFLRRIDGRNKFFLDIEKSNPKTLFLNDSKSK